MPRIRQNFIAYKNTDFVKWLAGEMQDRRLSQSDLAEVLSVSQFAVSRKMREHTFSFEDKLRIFKELEADKETQIRLMTL